MNIDANDINPTPDNPFEVFRPKHSKVVQSGLLRIVRSLITNEILWKVLEEATYNKTPVVLSENRPRIRAYPCGDNWIISQTLHNTLWQEEDDYKIYSRKCVPLWKLTSEDIIFCLCNKNVYNAPKDTMEFLEAYLELIDSMETRDVY